MRVRRLYSLLVTASLIAGTCLARAEAGAAGAAQARGTAPQSEKEALDEALSEAGSAPDLIHALEAHLAKYPESERRADIERALAKAAMDTGDDRRIIEYGERVLKAQPDDLQLLERVARALLANDPDKAASERALDYAKRYEAGIHEVEKDGPPTRGRAEWREEVDRGLGRALVLQCRAKGNLGSTAEAIEMARRSYAIYPDAEAAREIGRWLEKSGRNEEAVEHYADAFSIPDTRNKDADRAADRAHMGELYRKIKGSEAGLGDLILAAYDRTTALAAERKLRLKQLDPNAGLTNLMDFTLTGVAGGKLALASLKGKVVVMDFWATWCGPCRRQRPLYEQVMAKFKSRPEVVFLSVNTDEDRSNVPAFLKENGWDQRAYYEDGLSSMLRISSIPTTIVIGRHGEIASRMNGYDPARFADLLSERIQQALAQ
jgi:thiol-disulfide isomerase/thioredoxin